MTASRKGPGFLTLSMGALVGVAALVGGLTFLKKREVPPAGALVDHVRGDGDAPTMAPGERAVSRQDAGVRTLRSVLPADAWVVLDVDLSLLNAAGWANPNALRPLDCDRVSPPARLAVAVLPARAAETAAAPSSPSASGSPTTALPASAKATDERESRALGRGVPDLVVAALGASPAFRDCAKRKLLPQGGAATPLPGGFEVVENAAHTRLISQAERDLLLFATASAPSTAELVATVRGERPNAGSSAHDVLAESLGARALGITAALPAGWLERAGGGPEAAMSPLSQLRAAALGVHLDGTLEANLFCSEVGSVDGCRGLSSFLTRAKSDLLSALPAERKSRLEQSFALETRPRALHLSWRLTPSDVSALFAPLLEEPIIDD